MTLLDAIPNTNADCRKYKKDWGDPRKNERDWYDWLYQHALEYKYQQIIRNECLHRYYGTRAYDLAQLLQRQFLLKHEDILKVMKHILYYNKHTEIDTVGQEDERKFMIYLRPRFKHNVVHPYSILKYEYYDQMKKVRGEQSLVW